MQSIFRIQASLFINYNFLFNTLQFFLSCFFLKHHPVANPSLISSLEGELVLFLSFRFLSQPRSPVMVHSMYTRPLHRRPNYLNVLLISTVHTHTHSLRPPNHPGPFHHCEITSFLIHLVVLGSPGCVSSVLIQYTGRRSW